MISVKNLNKSFFINGKRIPILKNINFDLVKGESLAILGKNGSGKSTLINLLAGTDKPDSGEIVSDYKISWPIGLSSGFQGSLSAKENVIFIAKIITNNDKKLIKEKIKFVKNFSEIGEYFERPVKTYSAGMRSRLSFSLSMAFKFDLYLLDEITAAGDIIFQEKCKKKLIELKKESDFIYVSHNLGEFSSKLFKKAAILDNGKLINFNNIKEAIDFYKKSIRNKKI